MRHAMMRKADGSMDLRMPPTGLDLQKAMALLVQPLMLNERGWLESPLEPPSGWPARKNPTAREPESRAAALDKLIEQLVGPNLKTWTVCPFWCFRFRIAHAAAHARAAVETENRRRHEHEELKNIQRDMCEIATGLTRVICGQETLKKSDEFAASLWWRFFNSENEKCFHVTSVLPNSEFGIARLDPALLANERKRAMDAREQIGRGAEALQYREYNSPDLERCYDGLVTLAKMAAAERERLPALRPDANVWAITFIQALGVAWLDLLKEHPPTTKTGPFIDFVCATYSALGGEERSFDNHLRKAIEGVKRLPEWDGFERSRSDHRRTYMRLQEDNLTAVQQIRYKYYPQKPSKPYTTASAMWEAVIDDVNAEAARYNPFFTFPGRLNGPSR